MIWVSSGEDLAFPIDYIVDGEYVIPTAATATVYASNGTVLISETTLPVTTTSAVLTIPAVNNTLGGSSILEYRYVAVTFSYAGRPYRNRLSYRVEPFAPIAVTADDVRAELGLDTSELPDKDVDVHLGYLLLLRSYGTAFTEALSSGDVTEIMAQRAIAIRAAIAVVDSLTFRVGVKFSSEESQFQRMSDFDIEDIRKALGERLAAAIDIVLDEETTGTPVLVLATPLDPVTGA